MYGGVRGVPGNRAPIPIGVVICSFLSKLDFNVRTLVSSIRTPFVDMQVKSLLTDWLYFHICCPSRAVSIYARP